jgi:hypothetical protein
MNIVWPTVICAYVTTYTPKIEQYLVTMVYKRTVNLLHVSTFFGHIQGIMQQRQIQLWLFFLCFTVHFNSLFIMVQLMHLFVLKH